MRPLISAALAGLLLLLATAPASGDGQPVVLGDVVKKKIKKGRAFVGTVEPVRTGEIDVEAAGFLEKLLVEEGDHVDANQEIAHLRTTTLEIRLTAAKAQLKLREHALNELKNGSREEDKQRARARVREAQSDETTAEWKLQAVEKLRRDKQISEEELRDAQREVATAKARREALEAALALVLAGPRPERIDQATAAVAVQAAEVAKLEDEKRRHTVKAAFAGFVIKKHTEVGAWLDIGEPVVSLVGLDEVDVVVPVLEDAVVHLKRGMKVNVEIDALPNPNLQGEIHRIVPTADRRSRTVPVKVRVKNVVSGKSVLIKPGMFARCSLAVGVEREALLVPKDAVVLGGRKPVVYVYDAEKQNAAPVPVTLGVAEGDLIEIEGPLQAGAKVVIRGNERIFPGSKLRPVDGR